MDTLAESGGTSGWDPPRILQTHIWNLPARRSATRYADLNGDGLVDYVRKGLYAYEPPQVMLHTGSGWGARDTAPGTPLAFLEEQYEDRLNSLQFDAPKLTLTITSEPGNPARTSICEVDLQWILAPVTFQKWDEVPDPPQLDISFSSSVEDLPYLQYPPEEVEFELLGNFDLVDLDADGRADLVMSIRLSEIHNGEDCPGFSGYEPLLGPIDVQVAFRNDGNGEWVRDDGLIQGLPILGTLIIEDPTYVYSTDPAEETPFTCGGFMGALWSDNGSLKWMIPCANAVTFQPIFTDLNGDGRVDLIAAAADCFDGALRVQNAAPIRDENCVLIPEYQVPEWQPYANYSTHAQSRAWISQADGSWQRAPEFDLPFSHFAMLEPGFIPWGIDSRAADIGIQFVDVNRDGYTDLLWKNPYIGQYCPMLTQCPTNYLYPPLDGKGVLVNRGGGADTPGSAWCSSRELEIFPPSVNLPWDVVVETCPPAMNAARFELPDDAHLLEMFIVVPAPSDTRIADLNGDGWPDIARGDRSLWAFQGGLGPTAWLFSPDAPGGSVWVQNNAYVPPLYLGPDPISLFSLRASQATPMDVNADGASDWLNYRHTNPYGQSFIAQNRYPDLLHEVRTGRGGTIRIRYESGSHQRIDALEDEAAAHAADLGEPPSTGSVVLWTSAPVVASVTVEGPNLAEATTQYRYAHPRYCVHHRSSLGYRLVEKTRPDRSYVWSFYYQKHGRAGKLSEQITWDANDEPLRRITEEWELPPPGSVTGAWDGNGGLSDPSPVGQLKKRTTRNEYGANVGAATGSEQVEIFTYDDGYGYNFVELGTVERPSGTVEHHFVPRAPTPKRLLGWWSRARRREAA